MEYSGRAVLERTLTVSEAIVEYVASLPADQRLLQQAELDRFARWIGPSRSFGDVTGISLETYQEQLGRSGADLFKHLEPLKLFVAWAQKKGYIVDSIAKLIKLKKPTGKSGRRASPGRSNREPEEIQLTKEGLEHIKVELEHLVAEVRPLVASELLEARRDKDIRENGPYEAAKQHQAHVESRIRDLERIMASATLMNENRPADRVCIGSTVVVVDISYEETLRFPLVSTSEVDPKAGKISVVSPVGKALLDRCPGDVVEVQAPAGVVHYRVESIED